MTKYAVCVCSGLSVAESDALVNELRAQGHEARSFGHWNDAGGACCPHWGASCAFHSWDGSECDGYKPYPAATKEEKYND